jgi:hypothetical protein
VELHQAKSCDCCTNRSSYAVRVDQKRRKTIQEIEATLAVAAQTLSARISGSTHS